MNLDYLKKVTLQEVKVERTRKSGGSTLVKQPINADLRVFKNGRVYPSVAFAEKYAVDYFPKVEEVDAVTGEVSVSILGNGLDVFSSDKWSMVQGIEQETIFVAIVPRQGNPKIDLWGSCQYDGLAPKTSILEQGPSSFGKESLVDILASAYGIDWETTKYVDLTVVTDVPMISPNNVYHLPKVVSRGEHRGQATYVRRENIDIFPLIIQSSSTEEVVEVEVEQNVADEVFESAQVEAVVATNGEASDDLLDNLL